MNSTENIKLSRLDEDPFIEVFKFDEVIKDTIFSNYQRYDFYQLLWFVNVKGDKKYFLDFEEYSLKNNEIILVDPGQIDKLDPREKEGYIIAIHNEIFYSISQKINSEYLNGYATNTFLNIDLKTSTILNELIKLISIKNEVKNFLIFKEGCTQSILTILSDLFDKKTKDKKTSKPSPLIFELKKLIDQNFITQRETKFYADKLGMTCKNINILYRKEAGKTIKQHIQEKLILEIKKELRLNRKNLKEIAYDLGFNEAAYFTRFFKQHTKLTPSEFKDL